MGGGLGGKVRGGQEKEWEGEQWLECKMTFKKNIIIIKKRKWLSLDLHIWIEWDYTVLVGLKTQSFVERAHPNVFVLSPLLLGHTLPREVFVLFKSYSLIVLFFESSVHSHSAPWSSPYTPLPPTHPSAPKYL